MKIMAFNTNNSAKYTDSKKTQELNQAMDIITKEGRDKLVTRISELNRNKVDISARISAARDQGGVEENEELHMSLEDMQRNDMEINRLSTILSKCTLLVPLPVRKYERVAPGMTVKLENFTTDKIVEYTILGEVESDPSNGVISFKSPLGAELQGLQVGDYLELDRGATTIEYEILEIFAK